MRKDGISYSCSQWMEEEEHEKMGSYMWIGVSLDFDFFWDSGWSVLHYKSAGTTNI